MRAQDLSIYRKAVRTKDGRLPPPPEPVLGDSVMSGRLLISHVRTPPHLRTPPYSDNFSSCCCLFLYGPFRFFLLSCVPLHLPYEGKCQNNGRPEMTDRRWRPDMTESPSTGSGGQSSVLYPDGLLVNREILRPYNAVIQSVHNLRLLSIHIFQQVVSPD